MISRPSDDLCLSSDERIFISRHDQDTETVVHEIREATDSVLQSLGRGYLDEQWLMRTQLSDGSVGCLDDPLRVPFLFNGLSIVRLYRPGGRRTDLDHAPGGVRSATARGTTDGSRSRMLSGPSEYLDKPHVLSPRHLVVQAYYRRLLSERMRTYLVDVDDMDGGP